jgi:hypothetical protein
LSRPNSQEKREFADGSKFDDLVKSLLERHPGESRGPEHLEITGFRRLPRTRSGVRRNDEFYGIATFYEFIKFGSLKKSQPAGLSSKSLDFSPIFGIIYLGWTVTETDLSMEKEDFRDETGRRLLEKGTPG